MAHRRKPLGVALAINTAVLAVELGTGTVTGTWNSDEQRVTRRVNSADDERGGEKEDAGAV